MRQGGVQLTISPDPTLPPPNPELVPSLYELKVQTLMKTVEQEVSFKGRKVGISHKTW